MQGSTAIQTVIWDLDGTLLDSFGIYCDVLAGVLPGHSFAMPPVEVLRANFHGSLEDSIDQAMGGLPPDRLAAVVADFLAAQDSHYEVIEEHLFDDALDLAARMHSSGARNILVTNRDHVGRLKASPRHIVKHSTLKDCIDMIICGDDSEHRKPNPNVLGTLLESINPEHTLVIGDQFVDAQFAHNLGASGLLIARGGEPLHLDALPADWQRSITIVPSLHKIQL